MKMIKGIRLILVLSLVLGLLSHSIMAQSPTQVPSGNEVTNASGYRSHTMPDIGRFEYPLAYYSVHTLPAFSSSMASEVFFPGVVHIFPNDHVIYGTQFDIAYRIQIAMMSASGELDSSMLGTGPLMQYEADAFSPEDVIHLDLNGIPALRIDNLPFGPSGTVTMDIIAVVEDRMIEILVEPVAEVAGTSIEGLDIINQIIGSIVFDTTQ